MPAALLLSMPLPLTSSPQAISHGFPSVHPLAPSQRSSPKLFPRLGPTIFQGNRVDGNCPKNPCHQLCMFASLPPSGAPPKLFPRFTIHAHSSGVPASLPPAEAMLVRRFHLSSRAPPNLFPRSTVHPRSNGALVSLRLAQLPPSYFHASHSIHAGPALPPAELPPSHFHASQSIHARPAIPPCSLQRRSPQATSTLHNPSTLVRRSRLAPSSGAPP